MLYDLLVIATVLGCGWIGSRLGTAAAAAAALELLACVLAAVVLHEPVITAIDGGLKAVVGDVVSESWLYPLVFAAIGWGGFAGLRAFVHRGGLLPAEERDDAPIDRAAAALAGGVAGIVLAGGALLNLSMLPILTGIKPTPQRMYCDAGSLVLRAAAAFAGEWHEGRSIPIDGEPPLPSSRSSARLSGEPWSDADGDGMAGDSERYSDVDGSGGHTKDLYYDDIDVDQARRVGLLDKYRAGCWDFTLIHEDRERPAPKKPTPPPAGPAATSPITSGSAAPPAAGQAAPAAVSGTVTPSGTTAPASAAATGSPVTTGSTATTGSAVTTGSTVNTGSTAITGSASLQK